MKRGRNVSEKLLVDYEEVFLNQYVNFGICVGRWILSIMFIITLYCKQHEHRESGH